MCGPQHQQTITACRMQVTNFKSFPQPLCELAHEAALNVSVSRQGACLMTLSAVPWMESCAMARPLLPPHACHAPSNHQRVSCQVASAGICRQMGSRDDQSDFVWSAARTMHARPCGCIVRAADLAHSRKAPVFDFLDFLFRRFLRCFSRAWLPAQGWLWLYLAKRGDTIRARQRHQRVGQR